MHGTSEVTVTIFDPLTAQNSLRARLQTIETFTNTHRQEAAREASGSFC